MICTDFKRLVSSHEDSVCSLIAMFQDLHLTDTSFFPFVFFTACFKSVQFGATVWVHKLKRTNITTSRLSICKVSWTSSSNISRDKYTYSFRRASSSSSSDLTSTLGRLTSGSKWISGLTGASSDTCLEFHLLSIETYTHFKNEHIEECKKHKATFSLLIVYCRGQDDQDITRVCKPVCKLFKEAKLFRAIS